MVKTITWSNTSSPATASGIKFAPVSNHKAAYFAYARREVIVAAGAIQSPALLQLSGVGDSSILSPLGISSVVDLPTVGKNLQEQTMNSVGAKGNGFNTGGKGPADAIAYPNIYQLFGSQASAMVQEIQSSLGSWASSQANSALSANALQQIYQIQAGLIINSSAPVVELFYDTGFPADIGIDMWQLLPFSRGSVQVTSNNSFGAPKVTVNYFSVPYDLSVQIAGARLSRRIIASPPLSSLSEGETVPGFSTVPNNTNWGSDAAWTDWITDPNAGFASVAHPIGTCAMMRKDLGGVVDSHLVVYGTSNVRVVDASILPLQISAHLSSTLYGVAEKAADIIKADNSGIQTPAVKAATSSSTRTSSSTTATTPSSTKSASTGAVEDFLNHPHTTTSSSHNSSSSSKTKWIIIAVVVGVVLLIATYAFCVFCGAKLLRRRRARAAAVGATSGPHQPLNAPAPSQDMSVVHPGPVYEPQYINPFSDPVSTDPRY